MHFWSTIILYVLRKGGKYKIMSNFNLSTRLRFHLARTSLGEIRKLKISLSEYFKV